MLCEERFGHVSRTGEFDFSLYQTTRIRIHSSVIHGLMNLDATLAPSRDSNVSA